MAAPNEGYGQYPPQQYGQEADPSAQAAFEQQGSPPPAPGEAYAAPEAGKKKKRGYATQAFEYGAGANAGATPPSAPGAAGAAAYPGQTFQGNYPAPIQPAPYGQQPLAQAMPGAQPALGGYQAPDAYYSGGANQAPQGVAGITSNMAGMNLGGGPQQPPAQQPPGQQPRPALNQLYPTDLLNQPFNVSELDLPPPPCILPPNVCYIRCVVF